MKQSVLPAVDTKAARSEAKKIAATWRKEQDKNAAKFDRENLIAAIRTLDAMISSLPVEVRGKMGGFSKLATLKGPAGMLTYFEDRIKTLDGVIEKWLKKESRDRIEKIFTKAKAKREAGTGDTGKLGAFGHAWFDYAEKVSELSPTEVDGEVSTIEAWLEQGELSEDNLRFVSEWVGEPVSDQDLARDYLDERLNIATVIGGTMWGNIEGGAKDRRNKVTSEDTIERRWYGWIVKA